MLKIQTVVDVSIGKGLGLFTLEDIKGSQTIWIYEPSFMKTFTKSEVEAMAPLQREFIHKYATTGFMGWHLDLDDTRFINHDNQPNMAFDEGWIPGLTRGYALRFIPAGEEITCDYRLLGVKHRPYFS